MQIANFLRMDRGKVTGALIDTLLAELAIGTDNGLVVRYQGGRRWVLKMEHLEIAGAESKLNGNQPAILCQRGVYLITGGTGKLGRLLARYLADRCQAQLVLAGRTVTNEVKNKIMDELEGFGEIECGPMVGAPDAPLPSIGHFGLKAACNSIPKP